MTTVRTVISFRVSVPVLSVQIVVVEPRVSTAESLRTITLRPAMRCVPSDSTIVVIAVRPSGTAATASETAEQQHVDELGQRRRSCTTRMVALITIAMTITAMPSSLPVRSSSLCSGVATSSVAWSEPAICRARSPVRWP